MLFLNKSHKSIRYSILCLILTVNSIVVYSQNSSYNLNNIILYKHFDNQTLNLYDQETTNQRAKCEYYKNNAIFSCRDSHSSYEVRQDCIIANKQRWCMCMGERNDCFRERYFYW